MDFNSGGHHTGPEVKTAKSNLFFSNILLVLLGALVLAVSVIASVPALRTRVRALVNRPYRQILAKAQGDLTGQGDRVSVVKLKTENGILVEVYSIVDAEGTEKLRGKIQVDEKRDAYIQIHGQATNLALMDVDDDARPEILIPVYDENLIPRLHVFKHNPLDDQFLRLGPEASSP